MNRDRLYLFLIWLLLGLFIVALSSLHPTHATSPDSAHYLSMAANWQTYDGTFPLGYSLLIWLVASVTSLPGLWASKLVNWLALGFLGWVWAGRVGAKQSAFLLGIWLLPGNLRIATYTWSETVFIVLLLETVWWLENSRVNTLRVAGLLVTLVWVRYVGLFMMVYNGFVRVRRSNRWAITLHFLGIALLLALNVSLTGYLFGGPRLLTTEPWPELIHMMGVAALNEVLLYNYRPDLNLIEFVSALIGQLLVLAILIWYVWRNCAWQPSQLTRNPLVRRLVGVGLVYFLALFVLRTLSPFDPLNERLMAPGSFCWLMALVLGGQSQHSIISKSPERAETLTNPS